MRLCKNENGLDIIIPDLSSNKWRKDAMQTLGSCGGWEALEGNCITEVLSSSYELERLL